MIDFDELKQLLREKDGEQILSVYLRTDAALRENESEKPAWRIWLKTALRDMEATLEDGQMDAWNDRVQRLHAFLDNRNEIPKSIAVFFGETFERTFALPVLLGDNHLSYGNMEIAPLVWVMDEYERYVVALVDSENAHIMTVYLGNVNSLEELASDISAYDFGEKTLMPRKTAAGNSGNQVTHGSNQDSFEDMIDEHTNRFYRDVAQQIETQMKQVDSERIILGGSERSAHAVQDELHDTVKEKVIDVLAVPIDADDRTLMERIIPRALDFEREQERILVEELIGMAKAKGRAVLGQDEIEDALTQQRVELLVAPWMAQSNIQDTVKHLVTHTIQNGGNIEFVHGKAADILKDEGGVAARLYYTI